ncbi:AAA family ATPase [Anaerolineales bacterium HSG24]|nr:AAA family ATPase [Anaerolineales bacterium HSG24]
MSEKTILLEKIHITNFLSLRDVELSLKPLTVLVGPNASGKSNVLGAIRLFGEMMVSENLPHPDYIQNLTWAGTTLNVGFHIKVNVAGTPTVYNLELSGGAKTGNKVILEELAVGKESIKVISIKNGQGEVRDEDNKNETSYRSKKLALKSAGDYGNKPITNMLTDFIRDWEFYDFQPKIMRGGDLFSQIIARSDLMTSIEDLQHEPRLDDDGTTLKHILSYWSEHDKERFQAVNDELQKCTRLGLEQIGSNGDTKLYLQEGYEKPIPLRRASDGTLRLIAYYVLLNQSKLPPLITIEEPERNLHPAALNDIANVLELLAERTQVIITTHSSQLLDAFNPENLSENLGILLLQNSPGKGTQVINFDDTRKDREALDGWIEDFGIGSAIFDSELLQDLMVR